MMMMMTMTMMTNIIPYRRTKTHIWEKVLMGIWVHPGATIMNIIIIITTMMIIMVNMITVWKQSLLLILILPLTQPEKEEANIAFLNFSSIHHSLVIINPTWVIIMIISKKNAVTIFRATRGGKSDLPSDSRLLRTHLRWRQHLKCRQHCYHHLADKQTQAQTQSQTRTDEEICASTYPYQHQHGVWEEGRPLTLLMKLSFENLAQGGDWLHLQVTIFLDELVPFLRLWLHFSLDFHIHHHQLMGLQPEQLYNANEEPGLICSPRSSSSSSS